MKKFKLYKLTRILFVIYILLTIAVIGFSYAKTPLKHTYNFVGTLLSGYVLLTFILIIYVLIAVISQIKGLKWSGIQKRLLRFFGIFVLCIIVNFAIQHFIFDKGVQKSINLVGSLAFAFGCSFIDMLLVKSKIE